jgi:GPH family glycoside/pentoside/hexuronide:cation symporter
LFAYCTLNTGMTVLSVPYMAMAGEMTANPHERTTLFGARFAFSNAGAFVAAGLPVLFLAPGRGNSQTMPWVGAVAAALVVATALLSWRATAKVAFLQPPLQHQPMLRAFTVPFGNAAFRPLLAAYVIANIGIGVNAATFLYYYQHVLQLGETDRQVVLATFLAVFTASILLWVKLARAYGKLRPLVVGATVLGIGTPLLYVTVPTGGFVIVMAVGAFGLGAFVGSIVLIDTLLTDVLDHDLLTRRQLRSGLFFGVWRFASKLARAVSVLVVGAVLGAAGFVEQGGEQPPAVRIALTWLFGPGVGAFFLAAAFLLHRYRYRDAVQARVRDLLRRRAERAAPAATSSHQPA